MLTTQRHTLTHQTPACVPPPLCTRQLGPVNYFQTGEIRRPNAPLACDTWACRRLLDASLLILREVDPQLADSQWAAISPDGKVREEVQGVALRDYPTVSRPHADSSAAVPSAWRMQYCYINVVDKFVGQLDYGGSPSNTVGGPAPSLVKQAD